MDDLRRRLEALTCTCICSSLCNFDVSLAQRVQNTSGPTPTPLSPLEQLKHDLCPPVEWQPQSTKVKSGGLLHLPERIASLERCTDLYAGGSWR